jgi:hypothetical protein
VSQLAAGAALFDRRSGPWLRTCAFRYRMRDDQSLKVQAGQREMSLACSAEPVLMRPAESGLFPGRHVFEASLGEGRSRWRSERSS